MGLIKKTNKKKQDLYELLLSKETKITYPLKE